MAHVIRKWIANYSINKDKLDPSDVYWVGGLISATNVGIGTTDPQEMLDVWGNIRIYTGALIITGSQSHSTDTVLRRDGNDLILHAGMDSLKIRDNADTGTFLRVLNSGYVGIGTDTPLEILHLERDPSVVIRAQSKNTLGQSEITLLNSAGESLKSIRYGTSVVGLTYGLTTANLSLIESSGTYGSALALSQRGNYPIVFVTNDTERVRITGAGRVGIGTTSPQSNLHVLGSSSIVTLRLDPDGSAYHEITNDAGRLEIGYQGAAQVNITSAGSVGMGTTDPQAKLHVEGDIVPTSASTGNLGSASRRWANLYMASTVDYASDLQFISTNEKVRFKTTGRVGIGSTNPQAALEVQSLDGTKTLILSGLGQSTTSLNFKDGTDYWTIRSNNTDRLQIGTNNSAFSAFSQKIVALNDGKVGIGTTPSVANFEVGGDALIHTNLTVNGTTTTVNTETTVTDKMQIDQDDAQVALAVNKTNTSTGTAVEITNAGISPALTVMASGAGSDKVGIGTVAPDTPLHVYSAASGQDLISIQDANERWKLRSSPNGFDIYSASLNPGTFTIKPNGYVGIGTTNPQWNIEQYAASASVRHAITVRSNDVGQTGILILQKSTNTGIGTVGTGDTLGQIQFKGMDGTGVYDYGAYISADSIAGAGAKVQTDLSFGTASASNTVERMRITSAGCVGIGITDPSLTLTIKPISDTDSVSWTRYVDSMSMGGLGVSGGGGTDRYGWFALNNNLGVQTVTLQGGGNCWFNSGSVGIGTSTIYAPLHIHDITAFDTSSNENGQDNLFLTNNAAGGGTGYVGGRLAFGGPAKAPGNNNRGSVIAAIQNGSDIDRVGLMFYTHASATASAALQESMYLRSDGYLGIGTTNPLGRLHTGDFPAGGLASVTADELVVGNSAGHAGMTIASPSTNLGVIYFADEVDQHAGEIIYNHPSDRFEFSTQPESAPVVISSQSYIGVGTNNPQKNVSIGASGGGELLLEREDTLTAANELLGRILFDSIDGGISTDGASVVLSAYASEDHTTEDKGGYFVISVKANDTNPGQPATDRFRIDNNGSVSISGGSGGTQIDCGSFEVNSSGSIDLSSGGSTTISPDPGNNLWLKSNQGNVYIGYESSVPGTNSADYIYLRTRTNASTGKIELYSGNTAAAGIQLGTNGGSINLSGGYMSAITPLSKGFDIQGGVFVNIHAMNTNANVGHITIHAHGAFMGIGSTTSGFVNIVAEGDYAQMSVNKAGAWVGINAFNGASAQITAYNNGWVTIGGGAGINITTNADLSPISFYCGNPYIEYMRLRKRSGSTLLDWWVNVDQLPGWGAVAKGHIGTHTITSPSPGSAYAYLTIRL